MNWRRNTKNDKWLYLSIAAYVLTIWTIYMSNSDEDANKNTQLKNSTYIPQENIQQIQDTLFQDTLSIKDTLSNSNKDSIDKKLS